MSASRLLPVPPAVHAAEQRVGTSAELLVSDRISGPITFGAIRPVVVFPPSVLALEEPVQEAIACHELLHVRRRDWIEEVVEEAVRTVFWFHPAVRWLIGRIQLSREQVVDRAVIELTESRDRYVDALIAVAFTQARPALAPAPLFLRRRLLKTRIAAIFQETAMSTRRLILSLSAGAAVIAAAAVLSVRVFPLEARAQSAGASPVEIAAGGEHLLHARTPEYPGRAMERRIEGDVVVELALDEQGRVWDARVLSGPDELRKSVLESVLQWHYSPAALRSTLTQATIRFHMPAAGYVAKARTEQSEKGELTPGQRAERLLAEIEQALNDPNLTDRQKDELKRRYAKAKMELEQIRRAREEGGEMTVALNERRGAPAFDGAPILTEIRSERLPESALAELTRQLGVRIGDRVNEQTARQIRETLARIDEHLRVVFAGDKKGGLVLTIVTP